VSAWLDAWVADCVRVFEWDRTLYRRVLTWGMILGFMLGFAVCALVALAVVVVWP
jgi:hypothetical protein